MSTAKPEELLAFVEEFHNSCIPIVADLAAGVSEPVSLESLTDMAFCLRNAAEYADEVRKRLAALQKVVELTVCRRWVEESPEGNKIEARLCTGSPEVSMAVSIPSKETEEYQELMRWLGVSDSAVANDVVRPHWPNLCNFVSGQIVEGKKTPFDPSKQYPTFKLKMVKRRKVQ